MKTSVQKENSVQDNILENLSKSNVELAIECALGGMRQNYGAVSNLDQSVQSEGIVEFNAFARAVRSLFTDYRYDAIGPFRKQASLTDIYAIARTVRHPIRNLRVNSGVILSNVIDNRNACVVIDQLYAPVRPSETDTPEINGRANLIYVSRSLAKWARRENWEALMATVEFIEDDLSRWKPSQLANLDQTRDGLADLRNRLADNRSSDISRAPRFNGTSRTYYTESMTRADRKACASFRSYEYSQDWPRSKFYGSGN